MSRASIILVHFFTVHGQTITLNDQTHARHLRNKIAKAYIGSSVSLRFKVSSSLCRRNDPNHKRSDLDCFRLRPETLSNLSCIFIKLYIDMPSAYLASFAVFQATYQYLLCRILFLLHCQEFIYL